MPSSGFGDVRDKEMNDPGLVSWRLTACQVPGSRQALQKQMAQACVLIGIREPELLPLAPLLSPPINISEFGYGWMSHLAPTAF